MGTVNAAAVARSTRLDARRAVTRRSPSYYFISLFIRTQHTSASETLDPPRASKAKIYLVAVWLPNDRWLPNDQLDLFHRGAAPFLSRRPRRPPSATMTAPATMANPPAQPIGAILSPIIDTPTQRPTAPGG